MNKLANFMLRSNPIVETEISQVDRKQTLDELMVMPQLREYPVTFNWPDGAKTYNSEIDLLEACLQRAPDLAWYCHFLNLAKPYILERSRKRRGIK